MVVSGAAMASPAVSSAADPPAASVVMQRQEGLQQHPGAARPLAVSGVGGRGSQAFASENRPRVAADKAKSYASVLSALGMLGVIALHRLTSRFLFHAAS